MKIFIKWFLIICIFISICGGAIVFADDKSDDYNKKVQSIVSFFNSRVKGNIGEGEFEVNTIQANEKSTRYNIKYKLQNNKAFQYEYDYRPSHPRIKIDLELSAHRFGGVSCLLFNYVVWGDAGMYKVPYIIFPQDKGFTSLEIKQKLYLEVKDFDQDNDSEIIDFEEQPWAVECNWGDSNITGLFWPKVFHLDPKSGKLLDVSQRFPQVYKKELGEWYFSSESQQIIKNSTQTSPECKAKYFEFLDRVQRASGEKEASSDEKINFSGTWNGYRIISGQKRIFNLVLKQNNNHIEGISTDTLTFRDGDRMVQGVITGDINEMGVKFTKKWIDHPNSTLTTP